MQDRYLPTHALGPRFRGDYKVEVGRRKLPAAPSPSSMRAMLALDPAHRARRGTHHHGFGGHHAVAAALDAAQQRSVGDPRRGEDHVAAGEVLEVVDAVEILDADRKSTRLNSSH